MKTCSDIYIVTWFCGVAYVHVHVDWRSTVKVTNVWDQFWHKVIGKGSVCLADDLEQYGERDSLNGYANWEWICEKKYTFWSVFEASVLIVLLLFKIRGSRVPKRWQVCRFLFCLPLDLASCSRSDGTWEFYFQEACRLCWCSHLACLEDRKLCLVMSTYSKR